MFLVKLLKWGWEDQNGDEDSCSFTSKKELSPYCLIGYLGIPINDVTAACIWAVGTHR